jgi:hypothetical protein
VDWEKDERSKDAYRKTGPETEVFMDWRAVYAFEVREGAVVRFVEEDCAVVDVFWAVSK